MKRFFLFAMMCIVGLFGSLNAQTQVDISVGEGTNYQQVIPNQEYYNYSVSHQIYTADEMQNLSGTITSIAFKQASASVLARSLSIYMLNTDKESFSSTSDWFALTADNLVYSGSVTYPGIKDGWITYELSTPFEYTGGNLAVCVYDNTGSWVNASSFYTYETGASPRSLYKAQDGAAFTFDNIYSYQGSYVPYTWGSVFQNNQVEFGITITGEYKLLTVAPSTIELGDRPNGAWMRPAELVLGTRGGDVNVASVESTNPYFEVSGAAMPATVKKGEPVVLEVNGTQGEGNLTGQLAISYDNARSIELVDVTAFAYTPEAGDVYETATAITSYPFTATPDLATVYNNYSLPGSEEDGKDVVYEMNFTSDVVLSANVTGENGKVAVYAEDFGGEAGPMAYNNYEGPEVGYAPIPARPSFSFDFEWANTEGWDFIDADGDGFDWMSSYYALGMGYGHNSDFCMISLAWYNDALNPDDYMVTEEKYAIFPNSELSFWVCTATDSPDEHYGVAISTDGENFTTIFEETYGEWKGGQRNRDQGNGLTDWREIVVPLADYAGQEVYIALRHFDSYDKFVLCVDDVKLSKYASKRGNAISNLVLPAGKYYLVASSTGEFTVNVNKEAITAPAKPTAPSPANFAQNITEPTLSWEFGANTVEYQLLLGTTYPPKEVVVDWTDNLEIGHKIYELYNNKNYFWRVNTRNSSGTTYGDVWSFTTTFNVPQELALTTDKVYEGETTTLSWAQVSDRSYRGYNIYVNGEKVNTDVVKETSFVLENLPYNMNGNEVKVSAVYDEGESAMSEAAYVYVTGMSSVAGNFYEQDKVTPVIGGTVYITGTDEFGTAQSYTFVADENGAYEGEILAGNYVAIASVENYQNSEVGFKAKYDVTSVVDFNMTEVYNPVKYITATETEEAVELVWGMQRYTTGSEDFESGDFSVYPWNNEVSEYPFAITTEAYEGEYAMKSTCEGIDDGISAIELTVEVPFSGVVGFYYKVSCEAVYDYATFYIDGESKATMTGISDWTYKEVSVTEGTHTYRWEYAKDVMWEDGEDAFYVDNITFYKEPTPFEGGWLHYDDGTFASSIGLGEPAPMYWGIKYPETASYAGYTITKVAIYDTPADYAGGVGTYTANVYLGGDGAPGTLVATKDVELTGSGNFVELTLDTPVALDGTQELWVTFYTSTIPFPAGGCAYVGDNNSDLLSLDGTTWEHAADYSLSYTWMIRAYLDNAKGQSVLLTRESARPEFKGGVSTGSFVANVASEPIYVGVPTSEETAAEGTRAFASYNLYKKSIITGVEEKLLEKTTDTSYVDNAWATQEAGSYQWGVSANYEGNRGGLVYLSENFDGGVMPEGWSVVTQDVESWWTGYYAPNGYWWVGDQFYTGYDYQFTSYEGYSAMSLFSYMWGGMKLYLVSPQMDIKANSTLSFVYMNPAWGSDVSTLSVCVAESLEGPWTEVWTTGETSTGDGGNSVWTEMTVDLSDYAGNGMYVAFKNSPYAGGYGGWGTAVDNVAVSCVSPESEILWSKPIDKDMYTTVAVAAQTDNGDPVSGTTVSFTNMVEEGVVYTAALGSEGTYTWDSFRKGVYELTVSKPGYLSNITAEVVEIWDASQFNAFLTEALAAVEGLYVSPTGWAMWDGKTISAGGEGAEFAYGFDEGLEGWTTIDGNGDGHVWYHSSESEAGHAVLPGDAHTGAGCIFSESYCNALGALFPDDYVVSPERVAIGGSSVLKFYACTKDDEWASEHFGVAVSTAGNTSASDFTTIVEWTMTGKSSKSTARGRGEQGTWYEYTADLSEYAGQEVYVALRHFNTTDMFILMVDDVVLTNEAKADRALVKYQVMLDGVMEAEELLVPYYQHENLVDGIEYTTTVIATYTMGDSEEMSYTWTKLPTEMFAGVKNLSAELVDEDIVVSWTLPVPAPEDDNQGGETVKYGFETDLEGWTNIDADGDGHVWYHSSESESSHGVIPGIPNSGVGYAVSESYCQILKVLTPDNYFVSPTKYAVANGAKIEFWACAKDNEWAAEHFGVAVSTAGNTSAADFTTIAEWTLIAKGAKSDAPRGTRAQGTWYKYEADLSAYAGQEIYVAIRHFECSDMFQLLIDDVEISTGAGNGNNNDDDNQGGNSDYTYSFDADFEGWSLIDADGDGHNWFHKSQEAEHGIIYTCTPHSGEGYVASESFCNNVYTLTPDNYLVSPVKYSVENGAKISFWACTKDNEWPEEVFGVAVSAAGNTSAADFTTISQWTLTGKSSKDRTERGRGEQGAWHQYTADLSEYAGQEIYIAIRHFDCTDMLMMLVDDVEITLGSKSRDSKEGTWAYYDNGVNEDAIGGPASFSWAIKLRAADIAELGSLTKVAAFDRVATSGTFDICLGGDNEPGASVLNQAYTWTGINDFVEIPLTEAVDPAGQNVWIVFNTNDGVNYPAAECADTGDADGRWIYLASDGWFDVTEAGIPCTWMLRGYFEEVEEEEPEDEGPYAIADILGVRIYRNGELITKNLVEGTEYTDKKGSLGDEYCVQVVYGGEKDLTYYGMSAPTCVESVYNIECTAPEKLYGYAHINDDGTFGAKLVWPYSNATTEWLYYDDGVNQDGIGGPSEFMWGVMFPSSSIGGYAGQYLTKVALFDFAASSGDINIYYGGTTAPGTLVHTQEYTGTGAGAFVEFDLTSALPIDASENIWVVFTTSQGTNYPASCSADCGDPNSRWISLDGATWEDITAYGLSNTWMIRAMVASEAKGGAVSELKSLDYEFEATGEGEVAAKGVSRGDAFDHYNIYRGTNANNLEKIGESTVGNYFDEVAKGTYYYQVTAVYSANGEECESDPATSYENPGQDYIVVEVTSIDENGVNGMMVYPNPTRGALNITAEGMTQVTVTNALGQVMYDNAVVTDNAVIDMSQYEAGVYMVRITTETGVAVERITVVK